jgi:hypothetical protein
LGWHHFLNDIEVYGSPGSSLKALMTAWSTLRQVLPIFGLEQISDDVMGHPRNYNIRKCQIKINDANILTRQILSHHE